MADINEKGNRQGEATLPENADVLDRRYGLRGVRRIFDGFFTTRADGTGVGLAFCRRTIRSFDGDISCLAEPGEFAEFTIDLPAT